MKAIIVEEDVMLFVILLQQVARDLGTLLPRPLYIVLRLQLGIQLDRACSRHASYQDISPCCSVKLLKSSRYSGFVQSNGSQSYS